MGLSLGHPRDIEGGVDELDNHGDLIGVLRSARKGLGGTAAIAGPSAPDATARSSGRSARPRLMLAVKRIVAFALRRLWMALPPKWMPSAYTAILAMAARLPARSQARVRRFLGRLWAESGSMARDYAAWIGLFEQTGEAARRIAEAHIGRLADPPMISILMPVFNPDPDHLRAAIGSVQAQFYPHWELCIADYSSGDPDIPALLAGAQTSEPRIRLVRKDPGGIDSPAIGMALGLASGVFVTLLHHDALLAPHALYEMASAIATGPDADILYSDDDQVDEAGRRSNPYFKPDWNPELMLGQNLIGCLGLYRRDLVERAGSFHAGVDGSEDYDLALRMVAATEPDRIVHIPKVLYHWRAATGHRPASDPGRDVRSEDRRHAVAEFLRQRAADGQGGAIPSAPVWGRVIYPVPHPAPLVTVIIPTRDHADLLARTMAGLLRRTDYPNTRVLVVDNGSAEPAALALLHRLAQDRRVSVLRRPGPFNYAALNNAAVREADGDLILLLNNDVDVIDPDWMREMVSHAVRPEIGAVGAKLLYHDGTIQHAGLTFGMSGLAGHQFLRKPNDDDGYFGHLKLTRNVTAVTGACLMLRRQAYLEVGGLNETALPVAFNDVDLCLKLIERGYRNLWTPHAQLYHLESASRGYDHTPDKAARLQRETAYMLWRWGDLLGRDPYWNPNLSLDTTSVALAVPPRSVQAVTRLQRDRRVGATTAHRRPAFDF